MSKKKTEFIAKITPYDRQKRRGAIDAKFGKSVRGKAFEPQVPQELRLKYGTSAVFFGGADESCIVGLPEGADGHILIVGGSGSGKSTGIAMPTLQTWRRPIVVTDIKGELSRHYRRLLRRGMVDRPCIVFNPENTSEPGYDPFALLRDDSDSNLISNIWDIVRALMPLKLQDPQPFWRESEQAVFAAALLHGFTHGLSFSETICYILSQPLSELLISLKVNGDVRVRMLLGETAELKEETLACVDRGLRNALMILAIDPLISHALRGESETANYFSWDAIRDFQIFLHIPEHKLEQWAGVINLMYAQLFHYLECRPEQGTRGAEVNSRLLLMMDEFARFGRMEMITHALSTLRSKQVNIALFVQSIAQIDQHYGSVERKVILDNCQYQAVLRVNDPETQRFFSDAMGTDLYCHHAVSKQLDTEMHKCGYSMQTSEVCERIIQPHELATLKDVLLLSPYGFARVCKISANRLMQEVGAYPVISDTQKQQKGDSITMVTVEERTKQAQKKLDAAERKQKIERRCAEEAEKKQASRRKYQLGAMVLRFFPELEKAEQSELDRFECIMDALAASPKQMQMLETIAAERHNISEVCNV